jgi:hypothetical protein
MTKTLTKLIFYDKIKQKEKIMKNLPTNTYLPAEQKIFSNLSLSPLQISLLDRLNNFATYQAQNNPEVRRMANKTVYQTNFELKLALVALMTTCALLDPTREGQETEKFFNSQINIIQKTPYEKTVYFGPIRPFLLQNFLIPEMVDDWITYRDARGDGIYALKDKKTRLQGLNSFSPGGSPVMEFARFYRKFMEDKIKKENDFRQQFQQTALKSLTDEIVRQQLQNGRNPAEILSHIMSADLLSSDYNDQQLSLPKK